MWGADVAAPRGGMKKVHNRRLISLALFMLVLATFGLSGCGQGPKGDPGQPGRRARRAIRASPVRRVRLGLPARQGRKVNRGRRVRAYGSCATTASAENARPRAAATKCWSAPIAGRRTIRRRSSTSGRSRAASRRPPPMRRWSRFACRRRHDERRSNVIRGCYARFVMRMSLDAKCVNGAKRVNCQFRCR